MAALNKVPNLWGWGSYIEQIEKQMFSQVPVLVNGS